MKRVILFPALLLFAGGAFVAGMDYGNHRAQTKKYEEILEVALRVHRGVKTCSGSIKADSPDSKNIKSTIHVFKDIDLAVIDQDGIIVIKAYE